MFKSKLNVKIILILILTLKNCLWVYFNRFLNRRFGAFHLFSIAFSQTFQSPYQSEHEAGKSFSCQLWTTT